MRGPRGQWQDGRGVEGAGSGGLVLCATGGSVSCSGQQDGGGNERAGSGGPA